MCFSNILAEFSSIEGRGEFSSQCRNLMKMCRNKLNPKTIFRDV